MSKITCKRLNISMLLALLTFAVPQAHCQSASLDEKSNEVFQQFMDYVNRCQNVSFQVTQAVTTEQQSIQSYAAETYDVVLSRPGRLAMVLNSGTLGPTVISDEKNTYTYMPPLQQYTKEDAPEDIATLFRISQAGAVFNSTVPLLNLMVSKDFFSTFIKDIIWGEYVGQEKVEGILCHQIKILQNDLTWQVWINQGDKPLVRKIVPDLTQYYQQMARTTAGPVPEMKIAWHYRNWALNQPPPQDAFVFNPPPGAAEVTYFTQRDGSADSHHLIGKIAPDFNVKLLDGGQFKLSDHKGKNIVIIDFWAVRCPPCRGALPILKRIGEKYKDKGVVFCALNVEDIPESMRFFLSQIKLSLPVGIARQSNVSQLYDVKGIPQTVIIDKAGKIARVHIGLTMDAEQSLSREIDELLAAKPNAKKPDLACTKLTFDPAQINVADKTTFTCTLANATSVPVNKGDYDIKLFIDDIQLYHAIGLDLVPAKGQTTFAVNPDIWNFRLATPGPHRYRLVVDPSHLLSESNENNNALDGLFQVKQ